MVFTWEVGKDGLYVVEHNGAMRTGSFRSKQQARQWFDRELDITLGLAQNESEVDDESLSTASRESNEED